MSNLNLPQRSEFPEELSRVSLPRSLALIAGDWILIFGSIFLATAYPGIVTFLTAQLVIGSRQHALFAVMHEGTHYNISKNRMLNDWISNLLAAWPVGFSTERYRLHHWIHHRYLNTEKDPDWTRKRHDETWQFPMSHARFWKTSLAHLCGKGVLEMYFAFRGIGLRKTDLPLAVPYYAAIAAAITAVDGWSEFLLYWALPYFTVMPFLHRVRNAVEHLALPKTHLLDGTRNIMASPLATFFFGPHNANYHLIHHIYPFIPSHRLPAARAFLRENPSFRDNAYENSSYLLPWGKSVYCDMTGKDSFTPEKISSDSKIAA